MSQSRIDRRIEIGLRGLAGVAVALVAMIFAFLLLESTPAVSSIGSPFVTDQGWFPAEDAVDGSFNLVPIIAGTLLITVGAILLASPLALVSAIFCQFYAPPIVATFYRRMIELLAGIPSVVFGFWGLVVLAPMIANFYPPGPSLLAAILVVALMILPTIMLVILAAVPAVPSAHLQGATSLGMGRWAIIRSIVIPHAKHGIVTGVILGAARAIGETMAVVMVAGNVVRLPHSLVDPVRSLTSNIALEMGYALGDHRSALFASGLVLLVLVLVLVILIQWVEPRNQTRLV